MTPLLVYGALFVLAATLSTLRSAITRIDGRRVLVLQGLFLVAEAVRVVRSGGQLSTGLVFFGVAFVASYVYRDWWLLSNYDAERIRDLVEESLRRLRLEFELDGSGYALRSGSTAGTITLHALPAHRGLMRVRADGEAPKIALLSSLLAKRFEPLVPRLRIRLN